jgi:hypothetical protein
VGAGAGPRDAEDEEVHEAEAHAASELQLEAGAGEPSPVAPEAGGDEEGARLIALNMALNGTPRDETERYLSDNFELADTEGLLDDVYARAGG